MREARLWADCQNDLGERPLAVGGDGGGWDARFRIQKRIAPLTIPNAPAFSPDGKILYYADSPRRRIWACALADKGEIADRRVFASLESAAAAPDGAAVDAEGHLWAAVAGIAPPVFGG